MEKKILGISAFFHDSSAVLIVDKKIIAAVQEERFSRIKSDKSFPMNSIKYCLNEANLNILDINNNNKIMTYPVVKLVTQRT